MPKVVPLIDMETELPTVDKKNYCILCQIQLVSANVSICFESIYNERKYDFFKHGGVDRFVTNGHTCVNNYTSGYDFYVIGKHFQLQYFNAHICTEVSKGILLRKGIYLFMYKIITLALRIITYLIEIKCQLPGSPILSSLIR